MPRVRAPRRPFALADGARRATIKVEDRDGQGGSTGAELMHFKTNLGEETTDEEVDEVVGTAEVVEDVQGNPEESQSTPQPAAAAASEAKRVAKITQD